MDFRWLKTFLIASKYENFRQTAEMLYISQPTVTFHIKQLEDELDMKLFERVGRNIHLTAEGEQFKIFAQQLVELNKKTESLRPPFSNITIIYVFKLSSRRNETFNNPLLEKKQFFDSYKAIMSYALIILM